MAKKQPAVQPFRPVQAPRTPMHGAPVGLNPIQGSGSANKKPVSTASGAHYSRGLGIGRGR
jgi:hypothetical protein